MKSDVVIASTHIRKLLFSASRMTSKAEISKLMAALQGTGQHQSPYGDLYETQTHETLLTFPAMKLKLWDPTGPTILAHYVSFRKSRLHCSCRSYT